MKFNGNPAADLGLEYHVFSEVERDGKIVTRYTLSSPVDRGIELELGKYDNVKLVINGASNRYAPEIKYDVLYVSEDPAEKSTRGSSATNYLVAEESFEEDEIVGQLEDELNKPSEDLIEISKYASVTSAMSEINNQILLYKSLSNQFPEDKQVFDSLISENEIQLGKLSSLITTKETSDNMAKGLAEGESLVYETPAVENYGDGEEIDWDSDPLFKPMKDLVFEKIKKSNSIPEDEKLGLLDELENESLAEFLGFYSGEIDPYQVLTSPTETEAVANGYLQFLENIYRQED